MNPPEINNADDITRRGQVNEILEYFVNILSV